MPSVSTASAAQGIRNGAPTGRTQPRFARGVGGSPNHRGGDSRRKPGPMPDTPPRFTEQHLKQNNHNCSRTAPTSRAIRPPAVPCSAGCSRSLQARERTPAQPIVRAVVGGRTRDATVDYHRQPSRREALPTTTPASPRWQQRDSRSGFLLGNPRVGILARERFGGLRRPSPRVTGRQASAEPGPAQARNGEILRIPGERRRTGQPPTAAAVFHIGQMQRCGRGVAALSTSRCERQFRLNSAPRKTRREAG